MRHAAFAAQPVHRALCCVLTQQQQAHSHLHPGPLQNGRGEGPNLLPRALQLLPPGIAALELNSLCIPEAIAALARFTALQQLELTGNAMEVDWAQPAAEAVVPLLRSLRLLYCSYEMPGSLMGIVRILVCIPDDAASALMAASRLERLALQVQRWSSDVLTVCEALPALRDLRWVRLPFLACPTRVCSFN